MTWAINIWRKFRSFAKGLPQEHWFVSRRSARRVLHLLSAASVDVRDIQMMLKKTRRKLREEEADHGDDPQDQGFRRRGICPGPKPAAGRINAKKLKDVFGSCLFLVMRYNKKSEITCRRCQGTCQGYRIGELFIKVSAKEMLEKAVEGHYAVGQFNITIWNGQRLFFLQQKSKSPVILGVSEGAGNII